jgi:hypothetical protein
LQQDSNLTFNINKKHKIAKNYLLLPSSKSIKTLIAEIIHPKVKHIHKNPPPRLAHERKEPKRDKIVKILKLLPH